MAKRTGPRNLAARTQRGRKTRASSAQPSVDFASVDTKLRRADEHFKAIQREVANFTTPKPNQFIHKQNAKTGQIITRPSPSLLASRDDWSAIIGDCVHNLRSALDHVAHDLVKLNGGTPTVGRSGTAYPVMDSLIGPNGGPRVLQIQGGVAPEVLAFVDGTQPYNGPNGAQAHPLWVLGELDNMDKHRTLALTAVAMQGFGFGINAMQDVNIYIATIGHVGPFDENTELAVWNMQVAGPNPQMTMQPHGTLDVAFDLPCINAGEPLIPTLQALYDYVSELVEILKFVGTRAAAVKS